MSFREFAEADKAELNRENYERLCDRLGVKNFVPFGMKDKTSTRLEDLIFYENREENFVCTGLGQGGFGKSVEAAMVAEFLHICQGKPLVVNDRKREWYAHGLPMPQEKFSKQLSALGFYPCGLNLSIYKPVFAHFDEPAEEFDLSFKNLVDLDEEVALSVFERFMGTLNESSESYLDMVGWAWERVKQTPEITLDTFLGMIAGEMDRRSKAGETKAALFKTKASSLKRFGALKVGAKGLLQTISNKRGVVLLGKTHLEKSLAFIYDAYAAYLEAAILTQRKHGRFGAACIVEEEFDAGLELNPDAAARLERETNKLARYGLSKILITQEPEKVPDSVLRFSHVVFSFNLGSAVDFFGQNDRRAQFAEQTKHLDKIQMSRGVCQMAVFTRTGEKLGDCYPFQNGGFSSNERLPQKMLATQRGV